MTVQASGRRHRIAIHLRPVGVPTFVSRLD